MTPEWNISWSKVSQQWCLHWLWQLELCSDESGRSFVRCMSTYWYEKWQCQYLLKSLFSVKSRLIINRVSQRHKFNRKISQKMLKFTENMWGCDLWTRRRYSVMVFDIYSLLDMVYIQNGFVKLCIHCFFAFSILIYHLWLK